VNENSVFDTNDPEMDLAPICCNPGEGQLDRIWACWRQMDWERRRTSGTSCIDTLRVVQCNILNPIATSIEIIQSSWNV
jgi:hypothetical protein